MIRIIEPVKDFSVDFPKCDKIVKMSDVINLQYLAQQTPLPDFIWEDLKEFSREANVYHPQPMELVEKISQKIKLPKEMIYLIAGCDDALQMAMLTYGKNTVIFTPSYNVYKDVEVFGGKLKQIWSLTDKDYQINPQKYPEATLIILANPNNPTGYTSKEKVLELVKNNLQAVVVVDEVYAGFADLSVINEVSKCSNLVVVRSFSKDYGMAGNRIGYLVANPELIAKIKNKTQWQSMSYLSVGAAISALNHEDYFKKLIAEIIKTREEFNDFLIKKGFKVFPSKINTVLTKFPSEKEAISFVDYLKTNNIIISHGNGNSNIGLDFSYVRFAIGIPEQMKKVEEIISLY